MIYKTITQIVLYKKEIILDLVKKKNGEFILLI